MMDRHVCTTPLALVFLAAAATAACATADAPARVGGQGEPPVAREVVVQVKIDGRGGVIVTPDRAIVRTGQKLVIAVCCEELKITWKRPEPRVPEPACRGGECTLVGPEVREPVTVDYNVFGTCGGKEFKVDPRLIFIR